MNTNSLLCKPFSQFKPVLELFREVFFHNYTLSDHRILSFWKACGRIFPQAGEFPVKLYSAKKISGYFGGTINGTPIMDVIYSDTPINDVVWEPTVMRLFYDSIKDFNPKRPKYEKTNSTNHISKVYYRGAYNCWFLVRSCALPTHSVLFSFGGPCYQTNKHWHYVIQFDIPLTPTHVASILDMHISEDLTPIQSDVLHCVKYLLPQIHYQRADLVIDGVHVDLPTPQELIQRIVDNTYNLPPNSIIPTNRCFLYLNPIPIPNTQYLYLLPSILPTLRVPLHPIAPVVVHTEREVSAIALPYLRTYTLPLTQRTLLGSIPLIPENFFAYTQAVGAPRYNLEPVFVIRASNDYITEGVPDQWALSIYLDSLYPGGLFSNIRRIVIQGDEYHETSVPPPSFE